MKARFIGPFIMMQAIKQNMKYKYLGRSGLKVSLLSYGNWLNSNKPENQEITNECIRLCFEAGINFFDTAEIYGFGQAQTLMGNGLKLLKAERKDLVVSTKIFKIGQGPNDSFLSRKHIIEGLKASLKRLQLQYVDIVFCHRPDYETPLEQTCRAMSWCIDQGLSFYWGTSEWPAARIAAAIELCERLNLHKPVVQQCEYNMLQRQRFEKEYHHIFQAYGLGTTIWSGLASGVLSGKYNSGVVPEDSRFKQHDLTSIFNKYLGPDKVESTKAKLAKLAEIAKQFKCTQAQLALAWAIANGDVTTCILGFSKPSQVEENLGCLQVLGRWNKQVQAKINEALGNTPSPEYDWKRWQLPEDRRSRRLLK